MTQTRPDDVAVACSECGERVVTSALDAHLRQRHRIYQFRGVRRSLNDTLAALVQLMCTPPPDRDAWLTLATVTREELGGRIDPFLANLINTYLQRLDPARRESSLGTLARVLADGNGAGVLVALAGYDGPDVRRIALGLTARWSAPFADPVLDALTPLLADSRILLPIRVSAAGGLLRGLRPESAGREADLLAKLVDGMGKARAVECLRHLEEAVGPRPVLRSLWQQLEARIRMQCPRCGLELRRAEMIDHLWSEHRLLLEGQKVREPWALLEEWLTASRGGVDPALVDRCRALAQQLDGDAGLLRINRLVLRSGVQDSAAWKQLLTAADEKKASVCPSCFALAPIPRPLPGHPLNHWRGRLSAHGYRVEVADRGCRTRLEFDTPWGPAFRGFEPDRRLTVRGAVWLFVGPLVLLAFVLGLWSGRPIWPVASLLLIAVVARAIVRHYWRTGRAALDRAIDYAWEEFAPKLHAGGYNQSDAEFLAGLALSSADRGEADTRYEPLRNLLNISEKAAKTNAAAIGPLAALRRLAIEDAVADGNDPVPLVLSEMARCLEGQLPLAYGEAMLNDWMTDWWTPGNLGRLQVLLCDRAFEAGFEVSDLIEVGQSNHALGGLLEVAQRNRLLMLRLLWSLRASRPWDRAGDADTVFDLASRPDSAYLLSRFPDLLLVQDHPDLHVEHLGDNGQEGPLQVLVCGRGIVVQEVLFESHPREIQIASRRQAAFSGHELRINDHAFRFSADPNPFAARLDRWFRFFFNEFLPRLPSVLDWRSPDVGAQLRARGALACPECGKALLPRLGAVAGAV